MLLLEFLISLYLIYLYKVQIEELINTSKLEWHDQEIKRLIEVTFNPLVHNDLERTITKAEEVDLLLRFNKVVEIISKREKINPTLFFSKKAQKDSETEASRQPFFGSSN